MNRRAEEAALRVYPKKDYNKEPNYLHTCDSEMLDRVYRDVFMIGYEAAQKDLGWISVKERLPEDEGWYLVHFNNSECCDIDYFDKSINRWTGDEINEPSDVDYWMPIPELPKK